MSDLKYVNRVDIIKFSPCEHEHWWQVCDKCASNTKQSKELVYKEVLEIIAAANPNDTTSMCWVVELAIKALKDGEQ